MLSDGSIMFGAWLNLLMLGSRSAETEQTFALAEKNIATLLRKHPRGVGLLLMVLHDERPSENYPSKVLGLLKLFRPQILGACGVIETRGFAGAAHRAVGQSVVRLSGMHGVINLFGSVEAGGAFLADRLFPSEQRGPAGVALRSVAARFRDSVVSEMTRGRGPQAGP